MMRIFITGGTGLIGTALIFELLEKKYEITVYTRNVTKALKKLGNHVAYCTSLDIPGILDNFDAVINLAGAPLAGARWTKRRKETLCNSRWSVTQKLVKLINESRNPPSILISGSAVGYYGNSGEHEVCETSASSGGFTHDLCEKWEAYAQEAQSEKTNVCILRTGVVLSAKGGALPKMAFPFKFGLGCILGEGKQYISWIHIQDMINGIIFLIEREGVSGIYNFTSPGLVTNRHFSKILAKTLFRPCFFRIPAFVLTLVLGEAATVVTEGQCVVPKHLLEIGYTFEYSDIESALSNIFLKI